MPITLLNAPILTTCGTFRMHAVSVERARELLCSMGFASAIGHETTARFLGRLLDVDCPMIRREYSQAVGELALVLRLHRRLPEGVTLASLGEIESVGYSLTLLERII